MVLESILFPYKAENKPWELFFVGLLYGTISIGIAYWFFPQEGSFVQVFFVAFASMPLLYATMRYEEAKDLKISSEKKLIHEHNQAIAILSYWFLGITLAGVIWYVVLPYEFVNVLFEHQISTISHINNKVSASITGFLANSSALFRILTNNLMVLFFCVAFSFLFGAGAVFILSWNASVIAAAIGNFIKSNLPATLSLTGVDKVVELIKVIGTGMFKYTIHGIPEMMAYFYGGIAGGIISVAVIRNHFATDKATNIIFDVGELILIALGFLIVGAIFEVYVTPILF